MTGDRITELVRQRDAWPDPKRKGTREQPFPHLSGWCGNAFPLDHPNHRRCSMTAESPSRGHLACICPCHTAAVVATVPVAVAAPEAPLLHRDTWVWEADAAADVMLQEAGGCPMCSKDWESHEFLDDGCVSC